jgi:ATP-dependent helicase/nuclease subunit A
VRGEADIPGDTEGVRIMTIHSAKGLEFPVVTVPDLGSDLNFGRSVDDHGYVRLVDGTDDAPPVPAVGGPNPGDAFSIEKTAVHEYADRRSRPQERAESKRLLYVCTRTRDHLLLCGTHDIDVDESGTIELGEPAAFDDADRWCDWLQPALLDGAPVAEAVRDGQACGEIDGASYTVRRPPRPVDWYTDDDAVDSAPGISIPSPPSLAPGKRIAATTLVNAVADASQDGHSYSQREESAGLSPTTLGTVVHRINELRPPRDEWTTLIRRLSQMAGEEPIESDLRDAVNHAADAVEFVDYIESDTQLLEVYDEYSVVARSDESRIVGDIDRLLVTPDAFHIIDYKTNDLSATTSDELAEHYRPQMLAYALALLQHDRNRDVRASLRFTDEGIEERFHWASDQMTEMESELRSMVDLVD